MRCACGSSGGAACGAGGVRAWERGRAGKGREGAVGGDVDYALRTAAVVERLPKTRSGKILRGTVKRMADGAEYGVPATIDDPAILDEIVDSLRRLGLSEEIAPLPRPCSEHVIQPSYRKGRSA